MKDIALFFYYSSPVPPEGCFLSLSNEIAYRNMFLMPTGSKIHFEFPMFEDHSYNTICNLVGLRNLVKRPSEHEKYIIFRTRDHDIIGFYRVYRAYYQETKMFNNNGFVWGVEGEPHLIRRGVVKYDGPRLRQGFQASWRSPDWSDRLEGFLSRIKAEENISGQYQSETNRLVELLKNKRRMREWGIKCLECGSQVRCRLFTQFSKYNREHPGSNVFSVLNRVYNSNLYSRNVLAETPKIYLK